MTAYINLQDLQEIIDLDAISDEAILATVINEFCASTPVQLEILCTAAKSQDAEQLKFESHSLKSSSAALGAKQMASVCEKLEELATQGELANATDLVEELKSAYTGSRDELLAIRDR